jgi:tetratricopeptide (TPR) repeat protein
MMDAPRFAQAVRKTVGRCALGIVLVVTPGPAALAAPQAVGPVAAAAIAQTTPNRDRDRAQSHYERGLERINNGQYASAIEEFNRAVVLDTTFAEAFHDRGNAYAALGNTLAAAADYNTAIRLDPAYVNAYYNRGNLYLNEERYFDAIADYDRVLKLRPDDAEATHNRALANALVGNLAEAVDGFQAAALLFQQQDDPGGVEQAMQALRYLQPTGIPETGGDPSPEISPEASPEINPEPAP